MRTTLNIDDQLLSAAAAATGLKSKTEIVERGLKAIVDGAARRRLVALAGKLPRIQAAPRRRPPHWATR